MALYESPEQEVKPSGSFTMRFLGGAIVFGAGWVFYDPDLFYDYFNSSGGTVTLELAGQMHSVTPYGLKVLAALSIILGGSIYHFGRGRNP